MTFQLTNYSLQHQRFFTRRRTIVNTSRTSSIRLVTAQYLQVVPTLYLFFTNSRLRFRIFLDSSEKVSRLLNQSVCLTHNFNFCPHPRSRTSVCPCFFSVAAPNARSEVYAPPRRSNRYKRLCYIRCNIRSAAPCGYERVFAPDICVGSKQSTMLPLYFQARTAGSTTTFR